MPNNINDTSIIENTSRSVRLNALRKIIQNGGIFVGISIFASLVISYIENQLTDDKFNTFKEFIDPKRQQNYLSWGLASIGFSIMIDKTAFKCLDEIIKDSKELWTGKKFISYEEKTEKRLSELEEVNLEKNKIILELQKLLESQSSNFQIITNNLTGTEQIRTTSTSLDNNPTGTEQIRTTSTSLDNNPTWTEQIRTKSTSLDNNPNLKVVNKVKTEVNLMTFD